jgi:hypothetical protein
MEPVSDWSRCPLLAVSCLSRSAGFDPKQTFNIALAALSATFTDVICVIPFSALVQTTVDRKRSLYPEEKSD